jgi:hypothetical protein
MSIFTSVIKHVESEFDNIYRITTENGLILDIPETKKPEIGTKIEYRINIDITDLDHNYITMNGTVFSTNNVGVLISFGGLLGTIPLNEIGKKTIKEEVCLSYTLN